MSLILTLKYIVWNFGKDRSSNGFLEKCLVHEYVQSFFRNAYIFSSINPKYDIMIWKKLYIYCFSTFLVQKIKILDLRIPHAKQKMWNFCEIKMILTFSARRFLGLLKPFFVNLRYSTTLTTLQYVFYSM